MPEQSTTLDEKKWNLSKLPQPGDKMVGPFVYRLFENSQKEKERLGLPERWLHNYALYRGKHWRDQGHTRLKARKRSTINLLFANTQRTVANLTSRNPIAEVVAIDTYNPDGSEDDAARLMNQKMRNLWTETEQQVLLAKSTLTMEIYGPTVEKSRPNIEDGRPDVVLVDPYAAFPAPGYYENIQRDMPYFIHAYSIPVPEVEKTYNVKGVKAENTYSLLGDEREENKPKPTSQIETRANYDVSMSARVTPADTPASHREERALVIECWVRDWTKETVPMKVGEAVVETVDPETGESLSVVKEKFEDVERLKYPGGIRMITITNKGDVVLNDLPNPNVNPELPRELTEHTYLCKNFPFNMERSYEDNTSIWGFSSAEQVGEINLKIDEMFTRLSHYVNMCLMPPFILPQDCGINRSEISNRPGLILQPSNSMLSQYIRFLPVPPLPQDFYRILDMQISFFDRISAIQDIDRGETPRRIEAASAIMALQDRNAVLMRHKIRAVDHLVRERGRWAISYYQNFGFWSEPLKIGDQVETFRGIDYVGRKFQYVVEAGGTTKTELQEQADAKELFPLGAIDQQGLLETMNFPNWKEIVERMAAKGLGAVAQALIQAGYPEDPAGAQELGLPPLQDLMGIIQQPQGGPGNRPQQAPKMGAPQRNVPRAEQGQVPTETDLMDRRMQ
jgi:hypothetical protein